MARPGLRFDPIHVRAIEEAVASRIARRANLTKGAVNAWKQRGRIPDPYLALVDGMLPRESDIHLVIEIPVEAEDEGSGD